LVTRPHAQVEIRELALPEAAFVRCLHSGDDVTTALHQASRFGAAFDVAAAFHLMLVAGALEGVRP
jgi:hypothetical protein